MRQYFISWWLCIDTIWTSWMERLSGTNHTKHNKVFIISYFSYLHLIPLHINPPSLPPFKPITNNSLLYHRVIAFFAWFYTFIYYIMCIPLRSLNEKKKKKIVISNILWWYYKLLLHYIITTWKLWVWFDNSIATRFNNKKKVFSYYMFVCSCNFLGIVVRRFSNFVADVKVICWYYPVSYFLLTFILSLWLTTIASQLFGNIET